MKNLLSLAFALVALFSFNAASAQNCHQVDSKSSITALNNTITLTLKVAGLGNALNGQTVYYTVDGDLTGSVQCVPKGQTKKDPGSDAGGLEEDLFDFSGSAVVKNGSITIVKTVDGPCPNGGFDCRLIGVSFTGTVAIPGACNDQPIPVYVSQ
jgi:hypothetical protein